MQKLTYTIENAIWAYNPKEFMPIFEDGQLANRQAFVLYKVKKALKLCRMI